MKSILNLATFTIFLAICMISCSSNKTSQIDVDSIPLTLEEIIDEHHEDEGKVIADLNFFISKKDYEKNEDQYFKSIKDDRLNRFLIGNYEAMSNPKKYFDNDSLYYVEFQGQPYNYKDYNGSLINQYKEIAELYKSKYGHPSFQIASFPNSYEVSEGYYHELSRWDLGKRTISIRLSEWHGMFCINLAIFRNDIENRIKERKNMESQTRQSAAASVI